MYLRSQYRRWGIQAGVAASAKSLRLHHNVLKESRGKMGLRSRRNRGREPKDWITLLPKSSGPQILCFQRLVLWKVIFPRMGCDAGGFGMIQRCIQLGWLECTVHGGVHTPESAAADVMDAVLRLYLGNRYIYSWSFSRWLWGPVHKRRWTNTLGNLLL